MGEFTYFPQSISNFKLGGPTGQKVPNSFTYLYFVPKIIPSLPVYPTVHNPLSTITIMSHTPRCAATTEGAITATWRGGCN